MAKSADAAAVTASLSHSSFSKWPAWPLIQCILVYEDCTVPQTFAKDQDFYIFPASFDPSGKPVLIDGIGNILAVGINMNVVFRRFQFFQSSNYGEKLHSVVGSFPETF